MNKKQLLAFSFTALFAASAMGTEIPEIPSDIVWDGTNNKKVESGEYSADIQGGKFITVLGKADGTGPTIVDGKKFRGAHLQLNGDDSHVYVYGGTYEDKFTGIDNTNNSAAISYSGTVNNAIGHLYIYGGTFESDITGLGMNTTGTHTANTDIHILGAITNGVGMGVYGGVSGQKNGSASLVGNTSVTVSGDGKTSFIAGGNRMANTSITGNISLSVKNGGTVGGILGGNYINELGYNTDKPSTSIINGNIMISVKDGTVGDGSIVNGILGGGINTNITGKTSIEISGVSAVTGGIAGGSAGWDTVSVASGNISILAGTITATGTQTYTFITVNEILGKEFPTPTTLSIDNAIVGGNIAAAVKSDANYSMTESNITISGGSVSGKIFGGGIAKGQQTGVFSKTTHYAKSHVETTNITVDASENAVLIDGNIYGGGRADDYGTATVGDVNIVFKGDGANLSFTGTVDGNGYVNGTKSASASVEGTQTFTFDGYNGAFNGTIQNFDALNVVNSKLTGTVKVGDNITSEKIHISGNSSVGKFVNTSGATLTFGASIEEGGNLEIGAGAIGSADSSVSSVTLTTNASVTVKASDTISVTLTSSAEGVVVNKAEQIATSDVEISVEGVVVENVLAAWSFDVENDGSGVTVTMDVGENVDVSTIKIFHREDSNSAWEDYTDIVSDITLVDGKLTFTATSFSDYTAVETVAAPEPSAFGLLAGLGALALVASRRRRK